MFCFIYPLKKTLKGKYLLPKKKEIVKKGDSLLRMSLVVYIYIQRRKKSAITEVQERKGTFLKVFVETRNKSSKL